MLGYGAAMKFLTTHKTEERMRIHGIAIAAREIERKHDRERANEIAHEVGKMISS